MLPPDNPSFQPNDDDVEILVCRMPGGCESYPCPFCLSLEPHDTRSIDDMIKEMDRLN
jgi:hypothetical protein